ncbi:energy transducer TonB [Xanthobacteraceae bacterium Astr-EGSB]|uniref:energy transducer TonB n=1 Tax=Astrobacterium formosum TaxID=3069710 RepID=UPI0027B74EA4|nr:energy transducer TonB [Xanthobacteraceae bacterium Astr-EGSB]
MSRPLERSDIARWIACAVLALGAHAAAAAIIVNYADPIAAGAPAAAIVIDLAPIAAAPEEAQQDVTPGPLSPQIDGTTESRPDEVVTETAVEQVTAQEPVETPKEEKPVEVALAKTEELPEEKAETPPEAKPQDQPLVEAVPEAKKPEVTAAVPTKVAPPPRPKPKRASRPMQLATAPAPAPNIAPRATAPSVGMPSPSSRQAALSWTSAISAALERAKRYPADARSRGEQGTAVVSFSLSRTGRLTLSRIARSSGFASLDQESLEAVRRADFPPPPPDYAGGFNFTQSIRFNLR